MIRDSPNCTLPEQSGFLQCPTCKTIHGVKIGNQPPGQMQVNLLHNPLPGYSNCGTIQISYNIKSGVQVRKRDTQPLIFFMCIFRVRSTRNPANDTRQTDFRELPTFQITLTARRS